MFTAAWQYVANECRVATMQEEGGEERKRDTESWSEGVGRVGGTAPTTQPCLDGARRPVI